MYMYVYRIEYVSYRLGPYRIRIVSAADRIVPALLMSQRGLCTVLEEEEEESKQKK